MEISLREITVDNFEAVCDLHLPAEQQNNLASNQWSLVESRYYDTHHPRAIYLNDAPVGFIMWAQPSIDKVQILRFMIAHGYQGKGIGRKSLQLTLDELKANAGLREIEISYLPENVQAKTLYASVGFFETGMDKENFKMYAIISLA